MYLQKRSISLVLGLFLSPAARAQSDGVYDLSYLTKGAAVGDSYAAGIGAGNQVDRSCSRYDGSCSSLVALQLGVEPEDLDFTYTACSGAVIKGVNDQITAISTDQQFIIVSAGGNDADLVGILNSCVYSFYGGLSHPNCDNKLTTSLSTIKGDGFAAAVDGLIDNAKAKLAAGGNIYYVGYAQFFDSSDSGCDNVSWHIWFNLFSREYLTQARRASMNDVVSAMNDALRAAVDRAGPQVHFIDYDYYVGRSYGRYCQPGQDEGNGKSADRDDLFFYEMKTQDFPWLEQIKRRDNSLNDDGDIEPVNGTLSSLYGALMQQAIDEPNNWAVVEDDNGNPELVVEIIEEQLTDLFGELKRFARRADVVIYNATAGSKLLDANSTVSVQGPSIGLGSTVSSADLATGVSRFTAASNDTASINTSELSTGTVVANNTHVLLANNNVVSKVSIRQLFVSDKTARVFHPTQGGHALIANLILYQMAADKAQATDFVDFPPEITLSLDDGWPAIGSPACTTDSSATWAGRDAMISALDSFCADPRNLQGKSGTLTSGNFGADSLDHMNISISWDESANLGQHSCMAWFDQVTDACSVPTGDANPDNFKHGGTISYQSNVVNASLVIEPLVVRQIWNGGQAGDADCNDADSQNYIDQSTLAANIEDYCQKVTEQVGEIALSGTIFGQDYNDGTPSQVHIETRWPTGPRDYAIFKEECSFYLENVLSDLCSIPDDNNPMNWKHGGSIKDNNGILYIVTPTKVRPEPPTEPVGRREVNWHLWGYEWYVYGGGFANSDYGSRLLGEIRGCGAVTAWQFIYEDSPSGNVEWTAYGTLPLFIAAGCLERAIKTAGGFDAT